MRRRAGLSLLSSRRAAWLAIAALLLNALLPSGVALGRDPLAAPTLAALCGGDQSGDRNTPAVPEYRHCALCAVAGTVFAPPRAPTLAIPAMAWAAAPPAFGAEIFPASFFFALAQPRGPPPAA